MRKTLTITAWIRLGRLGKVAPILCKSTQQPNGWVNYEVYVDQVGRLTFLFWTGRWHSFISEERISAGAWHFVGVAYDGNSVRLYVDGKLDRRLACSDAMVPRGGSLHIGEKPSSWPFDRLVGDLDDLRVYARSLSEKEIELLAHPEEWGKTRASTMTRPLLVDKPQVVWLSAGQVSVLHKPDFALATGPNPRFAPLARRCIGFMQQAQVPSIRCGGGIALFRGQLVSIRCADGICRHEILSEPWGHDGSALRRTDHRHVVETPQDELASCPHCPRARSRAPFRNSRRACTGWSSSWNRASPIRPFALATAR